MRTGLVLGKFAPLHRGHQLLIETSLGETEHTIVLIYDCPELETPPLPVRSKWITDLYPMVEVMEAWDGPTEMGLDPHITSLHDEYLKRRLSGRKVTHFYSSESYGDHVSRGLGAMDRRIDEARQRVPISATKIRENAFAHRQHLDPRVYRDLITQVVLLGAPSTGKTSLARELARRHATVWMPEYGREYWEQHQSQRRLTVEQLVEIAVEHRRREDALIANADRLFFIDTDATTTLQFSYYYHETADERLVQLAAQARDRYDVFFVCAPDIPYEDTWDRSGDVHRQQMHRRIVADLQARKMHYTILTGSLADRMTQVEETLEDRHARRRGWS